MHRQTKRTVLADSPSHVCCRPLSRILFQIATWRSWMIIYLGSTLPSTSSGTPRAKREARPCTQVGILPFHPEASHTPLYLRASPAELIRVFQGYRRALFSRRAPFLLASLPDAPRRIFKYLNIAISGAKHRATGVTRYRALRMKRRCVRTFLYRPLSRTIAIIEPTYIL